MIGSTSGSHIVSILEFFGKLCWKRNVDHLGKEKRGNA